MLLIHGTIVTPAVVQCKAGSRVKAKSFAAATVFIAAHGLDIAGLDTRFNSAVDLLRCGDEFTVYSKH